MTCSRGDPCRSQGTRDQQELRFTVQMAQNEPKMSQNDQNARKMQQKRAMGTKGVRGELGWGRGGHRAPRPQWGATRTPALERAHAGTPLGEQATPAQRPGHSHAHHVPVGVHSVGLRVPTRHLSRWLCPPEGGAQGTKGPRQCASVALPSVTQDPPTSLQGPRPRGCVKKGSKTQSTREIP